MDIHYVAPSKRWTSTTSPYLLPPVRKPPVKRWTSTTSPPYFLPPVREPPEKRWTSTTSLTSSHRSGSHRKEKDIHYVAS
jgi:hypothetical protein